MRGIQIVKVEYVLPINSFIFVPQKSKQRDDLRNRKFGRTKIIKGKTPSLLLRGNSTSFLI